MFTQAHLTIAILVNIFDAISAHVRRAIAESNPDHAEYYANGLGGQLPTESHAAGDLISAGVNFSMGDTDSPFVEGSKSKTEWEAPDGQKFGPNHGELRGVFLNMSGYECIDSDGDFRSRYFSASEGMTDTVETAMAPVLCEQEWVPVMPMTGGSINSAVDDAGCVVAQTIQWGDGEATEMETTFYDARWAIIKDGHMEEMALESWLVNRPLERGEDYGMMSKMASFRANRVHRLLSYARLQGSLGRRAVRRGDGAAYNRALETLKVLSKKVHERYVKMIQTILARHEKSGQPAEWFLQYLTADEHAQIQWTIRRMANRIHRTWQAYQADVQATMSAQSSLRSGKVSPQTSLPLENWLVNLGVLSPR